MCLPEQRLGDKPPGAGRYIEFTMPLPWYPEVQEQLYVPNVLMQTPPSASETQLCVSVDEHSSVSAQHQLKHLKVINKTKG